jgi:hypothetical protein
MAEKSGKMYFARFTNKDTGEIEFYKFGHTSSYDAMDRFTYEPEQYSKWEIKIMKTVYGPLEEMKGVEQAFRVFYPKNIWVEEKISGVTEIVTLNSAQVDRIIKAMDGLSAYYYNKRMKDKDSA